MSDLMRDTRAALVELDHRGVLVLRFKEGVRIDLPMVHETINARVALFSGRKLPVLSIMAPDQDFHIEVPITDNSVLLVDHTLAEAVVAAGYLFKLAELHYRNFPKPFPTRVFETEEEAVAWLLTQQAQAQ